MEKAQTFLSYSLAPDESTNIRSTAPLAIFLRGVDDYFEISEKLAENNEEATTQHGRRFPRIVYYTEIRWLSCGKTLKGCNSGFYGNKRKPYC